MYNDYIKYKENKMTKRFSEIVNEAIDRSLKPSTFDNDELCACMECDQDGIPFKEFKKNGKHFLHHFFPSSRFAKKGTA